MKELAEILSATGFPVAYDHFAPSEPQVPPFICYLQTGSIPLHADGVAFVAVNNYAIELYQAARSLVDEQRLEQALTDAGIYYTMDGPEWLDDEQVYMSVYSITY